MPSTTMTDALVTWLVRMRFSILLYMLTASSIGSRPIITIPVHWKGDGDKSARHPEMGQHSREN